MSSSQSRGCLGKVGWDLTPPGSKKAGQGIPHCAARQRAGLPVLVGISFPLPLPISPRTDSSCESNSLGEPTCTCRAKCLQEEELVTPSWVVARLAGLGVPLARPLLVPAGEEAALPDGGDA